MTQDPFTPPKTIHLGVIGLGYVGLPLAVEFGRHLPTIGFDIDTRRIEALRSGHDHTREVTADELAASIQLAFSAEPADLADCNTYIVTVPTPVDRHKTPDLGPLRSASRMLGSVINRGDLVIYESTVYPGATEEVCVPELEQASGLVFNRDFFVGYSPERINPGDKEHGFTTITKVTAGSTPACADHVDGLYASVVTAGTHKAGSIRVAEAAKVIENTQRDVNIALINELAMLFHRLGLDTQEVLEAAGTKWNFLPFRPGLVGGHCISVDPYYLTHKAREIGHHPEMILAGRRINDGMGTWIAETTIKAMIQRGMAVRDARILVLGLAFKENCPDLRNTRVVDIIDELKTYHAQVDVYDPWVDTAEAKAEYGLDLLEQTPQPQTYDAVILAVPHREFLAADVDLRHYGTSECILFDVKSALPAVTADLRL
jgi:UDP-N-acetyl-D-galactosamine dehydrogenase